MTPRPATMDDEAWVKWLTAGMERLITRYDLAIAKYLKQQLAAQETVAADLAPLDAWLSRPTGRPLALIGPVLAGDRPAHLVRWLANVSRGRNIDVAFVPVSRALDTSRPGAALQLMAARLAYLTARDAPFFLEEREARQVIDAYLREKPTRRLLLVWDGLATADWPLAGLIPWPLAENIRGLVSVDTDEAELWLEKLAWPVTAVELLGLSEPAATPPAVTIQPEPTETPTPPETSLPTRPVAPPGPGPSVPAQPVPAPTMPAPSIAAPVAVPLMAAASQSALPVPVSTYRSPRLEPAPPAYRQLADLLAQAQAVDKARAMTPELIRLALDEQLISPTEALTLARSQPDPARQAAALTNLLGFSPPPGTATQWAGLPAEAWQAARNVPDGVQRARQMARLAQQTGQGADEAVAAAQAVGDPARRVAALAAVGLWAEALAAAGQLGSDYERKEWLSRLAPDLPEPLLSQAVRQAQKIGDGRQAAEALCALLPRLASGQLQSLRHWISQMPDRAARLEVAVCAAGQLEGPTQAGWLRWLRQEADQETDPGTRVRLWSRLSRYLPDGDRQAVLQDMTRLARQMEVELFRAEALGQVAMAAPADQRQALLDEAAAAVAAVPEALERDRLWGTWAKTLLRLPDKADHVAGLAIFGRIENEHLCARYLKEAAPELAQMPASDLVDRVTVCLPTPMVRSLLWVDVLPHLTAAHYPAVYQAIKQLPDPNARRLGLTAIAPYLPAQRRSIVAEALAAAGEAGEDAIPATLLAALAQQWPSDRTRLLAKVQERLARWDAASRVQAMAGIAGKLAGMVPGAWVDQAREALEQIVDENSRALAWTTLVQNARPEQQAELARTALPVIARLPDASQRGYRLADLLPYLPDETLAAAWDEVGRRAAEIQLPALLARIAPRLSPALLDEALSRLIDLPPERAQLLAEGLCILIPYLSADQLELATMAAEEIRLPAARIKVQACLAGRSVPGGRDELAHREKLELLLAEARAISQANSRCLALLDIAAQMPEERRAPLLQEALQAWQNIPDNSHQAYSLAALLNLAGPELADSLAPLVSQVGDDEMRARLLTRLIPRLAADRVGQILPLVPAFGDAHQVDLVLRSLIPHLPVGLLIEALVLIRAMAQEPAIQTSLEALSARWLELAGQPGINGRVELLLTLQAFTAGGSPALMPALTTLLPALIAEEGPSLPGTILRILESRPPAA